MLKGPDEKKTNPCDLIPDFWKERGRSKRKGGLAEDLEAVKRWSMESGARKPTRPGKGRGKTLRGE